MLIPLLYITTEQRRKVRYNVTMNYHHTIADVSRHRRTVVPDESLAVGHLLSRELLKLSLSDRTAIHEEIHGVRCMAVNETPELINEALVEFQTELDRMPYDQKQAYEECRFRGVIYEDESHYALRDDNFRLRFLRAELFDATKAAVRFTKYLDVVNTYWGTDIVLKRLIRFSDFNKNETQMFRKGYFQVLPFRDRSGRRIVTFLGGFGPDFDPEARTKTIFYLLDALSRMDVEGQQKGVVLITEGSCWCPSTAGNEKRSSLSLSFPHPQEGLFFTKLLFESVPCRFAAIHNCWPDRPAFRLIANLLTVYGVSGSTQRLRLKFHIGDELEMRYRLKSFGIPIELLPITETGTIKLTNHNYWMKTRKQIEQGLDSNVTIVECPGTNDVVFRQGTSSMENPGNVQCRDLILTLLEEKYRGIPTPMTVASASSVAVNETISIGTKQQQLLIEIIVNQFNGHFLEWDKNRNTWVQMTDQGKIKQKASVLLCSIEKRYRRIATPTTNSNSNAMSVDVAHQSSSFLLSMHIKSEGEADNTMSVNTGFEPYSFVERGRRVVQQQACCQIGGNCTSQSSSCEKNHQNRSRLH